MICLFKFLVREYLFITDLLYSFMGKLLATFNLETKLQGVLRPGHVGVSRVVLTTICLEFSRIIINLN